MLHATPLDAASSGKYDEKKLPTSEPHRDERQVGLDTNRAFVHYPVGELIESGFRYCFNHALESQHLKDKRKKQLTELIMGVLGEHPQLSYFQVRT